MKNKGGRKPGTCDHFGEKNPRAKLKEYHVKAIRILYAAGYTPTRLSWSFGVSRHHISNIVARRVWRHI